MHTIPSIFHRLRNLRGLVYVIDEIIPLRIKWFEGVQFTFRSQ